MIYEILLGTILCYLAFNFLYVMMILNFHDCCDVHIIVKILLFPAYIFLQTRAELYDRGIIK